MYKRMYHIGRLLIIISMVAILAACADGSKANETNTGNNETNNAAKTDDVISGKMKIEPAEAQIGETISVTAEDLEPNTDLTIIYMDVDGEYLIKDDNYSFDGTVYNEKEVEVGTGTADEDGKWSGEFTVPEGFGDDHDVFIYQADKKIAKANLFVETIFTMLPESGPIGTEIEITGVGLSPKMYGSIWHVNYDNAYTGMITGISTNGTANAVIRATGKEGEHVIAIESGASGAPFMSRDSSAINYISTQFFNFTVTDEEPVDELAYVEDAPKAAGEGLDITPPENKEGVTIDLDKSDAIVEETVTLTASGLPADKEVTLDWHTMVGNRVTPEGFSPDVMELGTAKTDSDGKLSYEFAVPDDLGGAPHLIDVKVGDDVYGQTYLRILPSIHSIEPAEGPPGTHVTVTIKGSGWTEFDNAMAFMYDNKYNGYVCGFNSQGTVTFPFVASGDVGYHAIDIYPSIYMGSVALPDIYLKPQLTYRDDHPGTGIPAIRAYFKVTE